MTTRLRRKANDSNGSLPISSPPSHTRMTHEVARKSSRSSVLTWCLVITSLFIMSCIAIEKLSGRKLHHPRNVLKKASHHVEKIGRHMKESSRLMMKKSRSIDYVNLSAPLETYDLVVVGCGPAGLTAALFASRMGLKVLVLGSPSTGSLFGTDTLDNFPSYTSSFGGRGWLESTMDQALEFGAEFAPPTAVAIDLVKSGKEFKLSLNGLSESSVHSRTVVIASGSTPRKLNLPHESELWGHSLHNCALCDGDAYGPRQNNSSEGGKNVVVVGGGDAAVEAVSILARIGVKSIQWIHRRDGFKANAAEVERVKSLPNVQSWTSFVVTEWIVKESNGNKILDGVKIVGSKNGFADPSATSSLTLPCDGAFLMIGSNPNTKWLKMPGMDIDDFGLIRMQSQDQGTKPFLSSQTSIPGVFAAGEAIDGIYRQALTAASDGAKSAMDVERFLRFSAAPILPADRMKVVQSRNYNPIDDEDRDDESETEIDCDLRQSSCIRQVISEHPVVIFSKSFCSYCHRAKEAMEVEGVKPVVIELDLMGRDGKEVQSTLEEMTGRLTVPNVFVDGETIGGGSETVALHESGELRKLLLKANAIL